jgi:hypothetical protein
MGNIENKLDQIIELLNRIDAKLSLTSEPEMPVAQVVIAPKPTKDMLKFQHMIEFAASMDRTHFLSAVRKRAAEVMEIRKRQPGWAFSFTPQFTPKIDKKIHKTGAQFYKDLKTWSENYARAVEAEGEKTLQRAIARLNARA